jgi:hypothetical protein
VPERTLFDHGFQTLASAMVCRKTVQLYTTGSYIFGEFGDSWETIAGLTGSSPRRPKCVILEYIYDHHSPTGGSPTRRPSAARGPSPDEHIEMNF